MVVGHACTVEASPYHQCVVRHAVKQKKVKLVYIVVVLLIVCTTNGMVG